MQSVIPYERGAFHGREDSINWNTLQILPEHLSVRNVGSFSGGRWFELVRCGDTIANTHLDRQWRYARLERFGQLVRRP